MSPRFCHGDFIIAICRPFFKIRTGDPVLFEKKPYGKLLKEVKQISSTSVRVEGYHAFSCDSRNFGSIPIDSIYAKVIFKISNSK